MVKKFLRTLLILGLMICQNGFNSDSCVAADQDPESERIEIAKFWIGRFQGNNQRIVGNIRGISRTEVNENGDMVEKTSTKLANEVKSAIGKCAHPVVNIDPIGLRRPNLPLEGWDALDHATYTIIKDIVDEMSTTDLANF